MAAKHVCIFTGEIEAFGGAERSILALSRFLHRHGIANSVLTYRDAIGLAKYAEHPVAIKALLPEGGGVRAKVRALRSSLVSQDQSLLASGYQAALHATLAGQRGFHTLMHDTPALFSDAASRSLKGRVRTALSNVLLRYGLGSGGVTIVTSEFLQADCWHDFHVTAEIARMGGAAVAPFRERAVTGGVLNLLSVSRVESNKRLDWIVDAFAALEGGEQPLSQHVDWHLRIAGTGSQLEALRNRVHTANLAQRVRLLSFVPDTELAALYAEAHLFVMPAVQGYGIPAVEALAAGIPVLVHRDSGVSDVLQNTPWATVARGGPAEMVSALKEAIGKALGGKQVGHPLPPLETEASWAARVAKLCGWLEE